MGTFSYIPWETSFSMCFSEFFVEGFWRFSFQPGKLYNMWWFQKRLNPLLNRQGRGCHYSVWWKLFFFLDLVPPNYSERNDELNFDFSGIIVCNGWQ